MSKSKLTSFADQFVAMVKGDVAGKTAEKVYRKRIAGLNTSFHIAKGELVDKEQTVKDTEEHVIKCRLNHGQEIRDNLSYVKTLVNAREAVIDAQEALEAHQLLIDTLEEEINM